MAAVAGFSIGPMVLVLAGHFERWPVLLTGVLGAVIAAVACGVHDGQSDRPVR